MFVGQSSVLVIVTLNSSAFQGQIGRVLTLPVVGLPVRVRLPELTIVVG